MKLRTKLTLIFLLFFIIASILINNIIVSQRVLARIEVKRLLINDCLKGIFELNLLTNEFILHENDRIVQQWQMKFSDLQIDFDKVFKDDKKTSKMNLIEQNIYQDYEFLRQTFTELQPITRQDDLYDIYLGRLTLKSVDMVYQMFEYNQLISNRQNLANQRHAKSLIIGLSIILLMVLVVFYIFLQQVLKPLNKFKDDLKIIGAGDLEYRIKINSNDEIGDLARSFNQMTGNLKHTIASRDKLNVQMEEIKRMEKEREDILRKLQDSNEQLENFAYVASHDLQEPLRKIISFSGLLAKHLGNDMDEKGLKFMNYITSGAERMQKLILDLLSFSRIETRGREPETTDMNQLLSSVINELSMLIEDNNALINVADLPKMKVDSSQIFMVFQNLINNGIKFKGSVNPEINIKCDEKDDKWLISVSDNGIGIDPQFKDKIFVIFQRLHSASEYPGTGIGLALVKKIIERHKGRIWVGSEPGKGSTFFIELPK